jgi:hypothetical protein
VTWRENRRECPIQMGVIAVEPMPKLDRAAYVAALRQKMEALLGRVADAINNAPDGHIIAASEEPVRDLFGAFRRQAFELGLQMRTDAAEAAFSPSDGPRHGPTPPP